MDRRECCRSPSLAFGDSFLSSACESSGSLCVEHLSLNTPGVVKSFRWRQHSLEVVLTRPWSTTADLSCVVWRCRPQQAGFGISPLGAHIHQITAGTDLTALLQL